MKQFTRGGSSLFFPAQAEPSQNIFKPSEPQAFKFLNELIERMDFLKQYDNQFFEIKYFNELENKAMRLFVCYIVRIGTILKAF